MNGPETAARAVTVPAARLADDAADPGLGALRQALVSYPAPHEHLREERAMNAHLEQSVGALEAANDADAHGIPALT